MESIIFSGAETISHVAEAARPIPQALAGKKEGGRDGRGEPAAIVNIDKGRRVP